MFKKQQTAETVYLRLSEMERKHFTLNKQNENGTKILGKVITKHGKLGKHKHKTGKKVTLHYKRPLKENTQYLVSCLPSIYLIPFIWR